MTICPKCSAENRPEAAFCVRCGTILLARPARAVSASLPPDPPAPPPVAAAAAQVAAQSEAATLEPDALAASFTPEPPPISIADVESSVAAFPKRPEGSLFAGRFRYDALLYQDEHEVDYAVTETNQPPAQVVRICSNPNCRTIHAPTNVEDEKFCTQCGTLFETYSPLLVLKEADEDRFASLAPIIEMQLAHPGLHPPILLFDEGVNGAKRYCLVTPFSQELPSAPNPAQLLEWGCQLAAGLDYLHSRSLVFGEELPASPFGLLESRAVWRNFNPIRQLTLLTDRELINDFRLLALNMYSWITGRTAYNVDSSFSLAFNEFFQRALTGEGFASGEEFIGVIEGVLKKGLSPFSLEYRVAQRSDIGKVRSCNEDSLLSLTLNYVLPGASEPLGFYAIADGMGGHATGDVASSLAIQILRQKAATDLVALPTLAADERAVWLAAVIQEASNLIYTSRQAAGNDMGSTLACALLVGSQAYLAHLGDSRIYLLRGDSLQQLTSDHSLVQHLLDSGQISAEEARTHPQRNVIYRSLGDKPMVDAESSRHNLLPGDTLLLCSDGLNSLLTDAAIQQIIQQAGSPQVACRQLVEAANQAGGDDNVSVILVELSPA